MTTTKPKLLVANTIKSQIAKQAFWAWGAKGMAGKDENEGFKGFEKENLGYLYFKSSGMVKRKGYVYIILMPDDTYTVLFAQIRKYEFKVKETIENVYCDMLEDVIDGIVG